MEAVLMLSRRAVAAVAVFFCSLALFAGPGKLRLMPDYEVSNTISLDRGDPSRYFRINIPDDVFEVRISLRNSPADLDLYLYDDYGEVFYYSEESLYNEEIVLNRLSRPSIYSGEYELEVVYQLSRPPVIDGRIADSIDFSLYMEFVRIPQAADISLDRMYSRVLDPDAGGLDMFAFDLPEGAGNVRVDIFDTDADMDFALNPGERFVDPYDALFSGSSFLANEHGVFDVSGIEQRRFYLMVLPGVYEEREVSYRLRVSADPEPSPSLFVLPEIPQNARGMRLNLLSTVEISTGSGGGSGCLITPQGHILTNYHVITDERGQVSETIAIGITLDERRPSAEAFLARALFWDEERDLAILQIDSGLYGQSLPGDLSFPHFELGDVDELEIGEDLIFLGYPNVGGLGSKVTITLTRGVLSGFEDLGLGMTLKTDGEINYGNSGGAALTADNRLVGLPTQLNPDSGGKIAYIHSVDMIPDGWLEAIGLR
jgi:S1-C subfamily serine protease